MQYILNEDEYLKLSRYGNLQVNSRVKEAVEEFDAAIAKSMKPTGSYVSGSGDYKHLTIELDFTILKSELDKLHEAVK